LIIPANWTTAWFIRGILFEGAVVVLLLLLLLGVSVELVSGGGGV